MVDDRFKIDSFSDYDEEEFVHLALSLVNPVKKQKKTAVRPDHFTLWSDNEFHYRFRLYKSTVRFILTLIEDQIQCSNIWNIEVTAEQQFLFALRYLATGAVSTACRDFIGICASVGRQIVRNVCEELAHLRARLIHFPRCAFDVGAVEHDFYAIAKFPRCIGAIGCAHVRLAPATVAQLPKAHTYENANRFHSLKVQLVCDANAKIENIVARWPGGAPAATIFANCKLRQQFEAGDMDDKVLLADDAYPLRRYLLTPIVGAGAPSPAEAKYNEALTRTRASAFDVACDLWKRRFPILAVGVAGKGEWVQCVTVATAVLHNIARNVGECAPKVTAEQQQALESSLVTSAAHPAPTHTSPPTHQHAVTRNLLVSYFDKLN